MRQSGAVKTLARLIVFVLFCGPAVLPAQSAFSTLYIFGDGVSTTTDNPFAGALYHGLRRSNGRVWVEVLAQRQGLPDNTITNVVWSYSSNNWSYFGQYSSLLTQNVSSFTAPTNASSALFVVWVNNADFVYDMTHSALGDVAAWTSAINQSLSNHWNAVTNLYYAKGARTLVMPNAVDVTEIPAYANLSATNKSFVRQRVIDFNTAFAAMLNQASATLPGIKIFVPDMFTLLDYILAHAADYGMTNALYQGQIVDALDDPSLSDVSLKGPGANYVFWDDMDPTAKAHEVIANYVQQLISPVQIGNLTSLAGSNRLNVVNLPLGLDGFVDGKAHPVLGDWTSVTNVTSTTAAQAIFVPASGPQQYYRLRFPFTWVWP